MKKLLPICMTDCVLIFFFLFSFHPKIDIKTGHEITKPLVLETHEMKLNPTMNWINIGKFKLDCGIKND